MKEKITIRSVTQIQPGQNMIEIYDTELVGFYLRVTPSGSKTYYVRYRLPNGVRQKYRIGRAGELNPLKAREEAKRILCEVALGIEPKSAQSSVKVPMMREFIEKEYLSWSEAHHQWSKDQINRLKRMRLFLDLPLDEITPNLVEKWRSERLKDGKSANTVNRDLTVLKAAVSKAVEWGILKDHPFQKLKPLKIDRSPNIRYLTKEEELRLREALDKREDLIRKERSSANKWRQERGYDLLSDLQYQPFSDYLKPLVLLSLNTGARQGELFRLQWGDIDFHRKSLALIMRGKRKSYTRHIPLNKEAFNTLIAWRNMWLEFDKLVFPSKNGERFDNIQTSWENVKREAQLSNFRWHDMRHHFASKLVMNGVPLNTVRELLGHTNVEMTLRYAHLAPEQKERAVATLDKNL